MKKFLRDTWSLITPYWRSQEKYFAGLLLFSIIALNLGEVYINVRLNKWNNEFYNSLQELDKDAFLAALVTFTWLAVSFIAVVVYKTYLNQMLQIRWRRWLTNHYVARWLDRQNYYRMKLVGQPADNPDQRISEDIGDFIRLTLGLSLELLSSVVTLFSFLFILWNLSGTLSIPLGQYGDFTVYGYMVWVALLYAAAGTWITMVLGKPLIQLNFDQQRYEADFRFALVRLRENSESIALYKGEAQEQENFRDRFSRIFTNYWAIMKRQKKLTWFTSGYYQVANIFPILVAAPRFFSKQIQLGGLMQTASAFGQVQSSLSYIIGAYSTIAVWKAVVDRLIGFVEHIQNADALKDEMNVLERDETSQHALSVSNLTLNLPDGTTLQRDISFAVEQGDSLLISGPSGCGKSTLLRALAGIWPYAQGHVVIPAQSSVLFLPQTPYMRLGTLREALYYPYDAAADDKDLSSILALCNIGHLESRLEETENWTQILSPGERQRLAFAGLLLNKPDMVFLDEATSALDEEMELRLYTLLKERLPRTTYISVGHRSTLKSLHNKSLILKNA